MKHDTPTPRPEPIGKNDRGNIDLYSGGSLTQYRLLNGVSAPAIAGYLRCTPAAIAHYESGLGSLGVQAKQALAYLDTVDRVVRNRARLVAEGEARRDGTYVPAPPVKGRGRWRTRAEADAVLVAQGRAGEAPR